jgi:hypothetical protein
MVAIQSYCTEIQIFQDSANGNCFKLLKSASEKKKKIKDINFISQLFDEANDGFFIAFCHSNRLRMHDN